MVDLETPYLIETERLGLRRFCRDDLDALYSLYSNEEVVRYLPPSVLAREEVEEILERWLVNDQNRLILAVELKETSKVMGWCGLGPLPFAPEETEVYYALHPDWWGKGYASEASFAVYRYGLDNLKFPRIVAIVHEDNKPSQRVIEKLGLSYHSRVPQQPEKLKFFEGLLYYS